MTFWKRYKKKREKDTAESMTTKDKETHTKKIEDKIQMAKEKE